MKLTSAEMKPLKNAKVLEPLVKAHLQAVKAVREFQAKHEPIFTKFHDLKEQMEVSENQLRTAAKNHALSYANENILVEYVMPKSRYLDPEMIELLVPEKIRKALGIIVTSKSVDEKVLKAVIKSGKVQKEVLTKALVETDTGSPRVTITIKG